MAYLLMFTFKEHGSLLKCVRSAPPYLSHHRKCTEYEDLAVIVLESNQKQPHVINGIY